ncbi:MAG: RsmB/NOP family class I SAM-dependent RNA methyltransferase [Nanoarchaeota archaeon]|nr:RsmB/NOP family class I SAM-dependent RNA methyltransferase [Nanoarchaeota archaeon]
MLKREFEKSYVERFGKDFVNSFIEKIKTNYCQYIRVNTLKIKPDVLRKRLEEKGFVLESVKEVGYAFKLVDEPFAVSSTEEYLLGYLYLQDKASMMPVIELNPKPVEIVLDAACAPGGKTSHMAQLMNNEGVIAAMDDNLDRLKAHLFNLQRLGIKNTATFNLNASKVKKLGVLFDKILLDAPCSATGTVWREKKRLKAVNKHEVLKHASLQKKMLKACVEVLKPGGVIVYSTCSLEKEENEDNTVWAEKTLKLKVSKTKYFFPQTDDTIGFYYAVMKK